MDEDKTTKKNKKLQSSFCCLLLARDKLGRNSLDAQRQRRDSSAAAARLDMPSSGKQEMK